MICPYCDSDEAVMRPTVRTEFNPDGKITIVRTVYCPLCRNASYAIRTIDDRDDAYTVIRRDELKDRTGIRMVRPFLMKRPCR